MARSGGLEVCSKDILLFASFVTMHRMSDRSSSQSLLIFEKARRGGAKDDAADVRQTIGFR
jgi:hypothetical protein